MSSRLTWGLVLSFFALGFLLLLRHELWQDEWQAWLIALHSSSLTELFHNLRYEGHPGLWHLGLFTLSRFTGRPLAMQVCHLLLASATVYLFLRYSPFTRLEKILFVFGYFPFFEYAAISRNYAPGLLLIFLFCAVFPARLPQRFLVLCGILFLLAQTNVYSLFLALALGSALVVTSFTDASFNLRQHTFQFPAGLALLAAGVGLSLRQLVPPPDSGVAVGWTLDFIWPHFARTLATFWESFVPIPAATYHFWDTNLIADPYLKFFLSLLLLAFPVLLFLRQPLVLGLFAFGTFEILTFGYTKYFGSIRHHGHLYILFLACLWLSRSFPARELTGAWAKGLADFSRRNKDRFLVALLGAHLLAGIMAYGLDLAYPFSAGQETARFIKENHWDRLLLAGDEDDAASVLAGYLGRLIYYPGSARWGSFVISDNKRKALTDAEVLAKTRELAARHHRDVLLILNRELAAPEHPVSKVQQFTDSIVPAERYYLYLVKSDG